MSRRNKAEILQDYLPQGAIEKILDWQQDFKFNLRISRERKTKLGDYRSPHGKHGHRISVNHNLNSYAFLLTLVHEIAHLVTWEKHKYRANPHGKEWKENFKMLIDEFTGRQIFPEDVEKAIGEYMNNPAASSCRDEHLMKVLNRYDKSPALYLEELSNGEKFIIYNGRVFEKGDKVRKRFICVECATNRKYLFSPVAEVKRVVVTPCP